MQAVVGRVRARREKKSVRGGGGGRDGEREKGGEDAHLGNFFSREHRQFVGPRHVSACVVTDGGSLSPAPSFLGCDFF